jgi:TolB protein
MKFRLFRHTLWVAALAIPSLLVVWRPSHSQDWFSTGINLGAPRIRLAVSDFPSNSVDQQLVSLTQEFNQTLWNDLDNAGIFEMVSKSLYPLKAPQEPEEVVFNNWTDPPASAQMLAFGKTEVANANLVITARLFDVKSPSSPSVLAKRYVATMNEIATREAAHRCAGNQPHAHCIREQANRPPGSLGDGLRWFQPKAHHQLRCAGPYSALVGG